MTVDFGAGPTPIYSTASIAYDQWNLIEIERAGLTVTLTLSTEAGPGEVTRDVVTERLRRSGFKKKNV